MSEYTIKDVIIDPDDPRVEVSKEYYFGYDPSRPLKDARQDAGTAVLTKVKRESDEPFYFGSTGYSCIIRKKELESKYVPFDLSNEEDRARLREAWIRPKCRPSVGLKIIAMNIDCVFIHGEKGQSPGDLLNKYEFIDSTPCGKLKERENDTN